MTIPRRFTMPIVGVLCAALVAGCSAQPTASPTPDASQLAAQDAASRDAYNAAICPVFDAILILDPRLAALRAVGDAGDPTAIDEAEIGALIEELGTQLDTLQTVPDWEAGRNLRYQVITALHAIRARLLQVADDPSSPQSLRRLADLPFIASTAMDLAYNQAFHAGHVCGTSEGS